MKQDKLNFLMLLVLMLCVLSSNSQTFKSKGVTYAIYNDNDICKEIGVKKGICSGKVVIPSQVNYYGTIFTVAYIDDQAFEGCKSLTSVVLPNTIESVKGFSYCTRLTSVTFGKSVRLIDGFAFRGCKSLKSITIPNTVTRIGVHAFDGCTGLTSVTIGESVKIIGENAFLDCPGLIKIICKAKTPPSFDINTYTYSPSKPFYDYYKPTLYVPAESIEDYKNAPYWGRFAKICAIK